MFGGLNPAIGRIGGKRLLKKIIVDEYFPKNYEDLIYVEPFVGAGNIFFYKNPSIKEIINDKDKFMTDILKGLKKYDGYQISEDINGNYNKEIFNKIKNYKPKTEYEKFIRNLILTKASFFGLRKSVGKKIIKSKFDNSFRERLQNTVILNEDYEKIIKKYDSKSTFFYLDPPYENSKNLYEFDYLPIKNVFNILKNIKGKFLLSYNDSKEARNLFKDYNISVIKTRYANPKNYHEKKEKKELLISNY